MNPPLTYELCDDWLIFARDAAGNRFYVSTELWPEWLDLHEGAYQEPGAVEKYIRPTARERWTTLAWHAVPSDL